MVDDWLKELLRCPVTGRRLVWTDSDEVVTDDGTESYPIVNGVPILIDERRSVLRKADYLSLRGDPDDHPTRVSAKRRLAAAVERRLPSLSRNVGTRENFQQLLGLLRDESAVSVPIKVLVVGGSTAGTDFDVILGARDLRLAETDIAFGPRTRVICDGHALPFADGSFDGVICQAVLEHVLDPPTVVGEIHRVLRDRGLVYSEVPFMQQVHGGAHDVTRFTLVGHRRLYRFFDVVSAGAQGGPGMALAWTWNYYLRSWATSNRQVRLAEWIARASLGWVTRWDDVLVSRSAGVDAASGTFLLGRRRAIPVDDREVLDGYRGAGQTGGLSRW
ncbi:MAG: methyltransferase domain-containing protein [Solirubrobacteraceae bacterium]